MLSSALRVVQRRTLGSTGTAGMTFSQVRPITHFTKLIPICTRLVGFVLPIHSLWYNLLSTDVVDLSQTYLVVEEVLSTIFTNKDAVDHDHEYNKEFRKNNYDDDNDDDIQVDECEHYAYVYTPLACPFAQR